MHQHKLAPQRGSRKLHPRPPMTAARVALGRGPESLLGFYSFLLGLASFLGLKFYLLPESSGLPSSLQKRMLQVGGTSYITLYVKGNYHYTLCCNSGTDYTETASTAHRGQQHQYFKTPPGQGPAVCVNVEVGTRMVCCPHHQAV